MSISGVFLNTSKKMEYTNIKWGEKVLDICVIFKD